MSSGDAAALLGLLHFFWMRAAKNNFAEPAIYAVVIVFLLGWRVVWAWRDARKVGALRAAAVTR